MAKLLLKHGANVNVVGLLGMTPTMFAAMSPDGEMLKLLLSHHPDLDALDSRGQTALDRAMNEEADLNVDILRSAGAKLAKELKAELHRSRSTRR